MFLRYITCMLDADDYNFPGKDGHDYGSRFLFRQRYIGNYLGRRLKAVRFPTEGYNALIIDAYRAYRAAAEECSIVSVKSLSVPIYFNQARYDALGPDEHHEFFLGMYIEGVEKAKRQFPIPYDVIMAGIDEFRRGGYKNEWLYKRKLLRPLGLHASLLCDMDSVRFRLTLKLERKGTVVYEQPILETSPDEICFAHKFKDVVLDGNEIVVTDMFQDPRFKLDIASLG